MTAFAQSAQMLQISDAQRGRPPAEPFRAVRFFCADTSGPLKTVRKIDAAAFHALASAKEARALIESEISRLEASGRRRWHLAIPPPAASGFAIDLSRNADRYDCLFGELEEQFETLDGALRWVTRALSRDYRLHITRVNGRSRAWRLEPAQTHVSSDVLAMGHLSILDAFRTKSTTIRRNNFTLE